MAVFRLLGVWAPLHASWSKGGRATHAACVPFFTEMEATFRVLLEKLAASMPAMDTMGTGDSAQLLQAGEY
jgi:hypothetical protein